MSGRRIENTPDTALAVLDAELAQARGAAVAVSEADYAESLRMAEEIGKGMGFSRRNVEENLQNFAELGERCLAEAQELGLMHDEGVVRSKTEHSIAAYIRRVTRRELKDCGVTDLQNVIETLKQWIARIENPEVKGHLEQHLADMPGA